MGLLDSVIGDLTGGGASGASSGMGSVLSGLLGGGGQATSTGSQGAATQGMSGGIGGLVSKFEQGGLGHIAQSWIGNGPNHPVSPQQLQGVLGEKQVQGMASQAGMQSHDFLNQLSQHLPKAVDAMTPNGQVPAEGSMSV